MEVLNGVEVRAFPGTSDVLRAHAAALPQPDQLCGPFWAALVTGRPDLGRLACAAGTAVWEGEAAWSRPAGEPAHAVNWEGLPRAASPEAAGTSPDGVGRALRSGARDGLEAVPVTGEWTTGRLVALLRLLVDGAAPGVVIANPHTAPLVRHADEAGLRAYLDTGADPWPTEQEWRVGHFVGVWGAVFGRRGALVALADGYPSLGSDGLHLQPASRMARALARSAPGSGGLILRTPKARVPWLEDRLTEIGLEPRWWENP
ncbi:hypothetical protein LO762_26045 [Actinocorallia sp. API 0066]|uniref:DUF6885 family protein n=1 Tax=Actinocorallia sp. API 0066 TaxID=2896846 RepID=UPI001E46DDE0|nr:hypothetical protein [Actinocorallia sp. API 0066]MCD0452618.1 hypothetical protein [Actinocorallia sp. API 0066]